MLLKNWVFATIIFLCISFGAWTGYIITKAILQDERQVVVQVERQTSDLTEWELLEMAIVTTESRYNKYARSNMNALGLFQETEIYVKECNKIVGEDRYVHSEAYNPVKAVEMFNIYQNDKNPKHDPDKAIHLHNPGSTSYAGLVWKSMEEVKKYEEARKAITQYHTEHPDTNR